MPIVNYNWEYDTINAIIIYKNNIYSTFISSYNNFIAKTSRVMPH